MATELARVRFSVDDYHRMAETGILHEDARLELIGGEIVQMSPVGSRHAACVKRLNRLLGRRLGDEAVLGVQDPVRLGDDTEPEPDVMILQPREDFYEQAAPTAADVVLLIEVADSSLAYDRAIKLPRYAQAGVPEVWLVDLDGQAIERHTLPAEAGFLDVRRFVRGTALASLAVPRLVVPVDTVLG